MYPKNVRYREEIRKVKKDRKKEIKKKNKRIKIGSKVKYLGDSNWAYENGKIYEVVGYDEELEAYAVMSDAFGEAYAVGPDDLEEI